MSSRLAVVPVLLALALAGALAASASAESGGAGPASSGSDAGPASSGHVAASGTRSGVLKEGSRGPVVAQLQRKLHVPADAVFGPQTVHAVRRFQQRAHLTVDGVVGAQTAHALGLDLAAGRSASVGPRVRVPAVLRRIATCESGGNPRAVSPGGTYRGKYQFDRETWHAIGGHGDPARASAAEQDRRALALYRERGTSPWPVCGAA